MSELHEELLIFPNQNTYQWVLSSGKSRFFAILYELEMCDRMKMAAGLGVRILGMIARITEFSADVIDGELGI